jgi:L-malate glycosyltransferase
VACVLMVLDSMDIGGAERHVIALTQLLTRCGHEVRIICSRGGPLLGEAAEAGVVVVPVGRELVKRRISPAFTAQLKRELDQRPVDLVHAHMFGSAVAAASALECRKCPLVITEHTEGAWRTSTEEAIMADAYRRSAAVIAVSAAIGRQLAVRGHVPASLVHVIPNAAFVSPLSPPSPDRS